MEFKKLTSESDLHLAYPILRELRADLELNDLLKSEVILFGAFLEGELVGVASIDLYPHIKRQLCAWVHDLVVKSSYRNKGIGKSLMQFLESWAKDQGASRLAVHTLKDKSDSQRFYASKLNYPLSAYVYYRELGN